MTAMATKDLWFLPQSGPGRQYLMEYEPVTTVPNAGKALSIRMHRKLAAGEIQREPVHHVVLAFSELVAKRMCANGQVVERRLIDGGDHTPAAIPAYDLAIPWIEGRFAADPPTPVDSCPDLG